MRDLVADGGKVAVWWRITRHVHGRAVRRRSAPRAARSRRRALDFVRVEDGLIVRNDSYWDDSAIARQLGLLPAKGSRQERMLKGLLNAKTRLTRRG